LNIIKKSRILKFKKPLLSVFAFGFVFFNRKKSVFGSGFGLFNRKKSVFNYGFGFSLKNRKPNRKPVIFGFLCMKVVVKNKIFAKNSTKKGLNQKSVRNILKSGLRKIGQKNNIFTKLKLFCQFYAQTSIFFIKVCFLPNANILDYGNDS
jgi:hypothetical protein